MALVDKIEQMEQKFWPIAFKKAKETTRKTLSPKNYKGGVFAQFACLFLGIAWLGVFMLSESLRLEHRVGEMLYDPLFSGVEGNIFHEED